MKVLYEYLLRDVVKRIQARNIWCFKDTVLDRNDKEQLPREQLRFIGGVLLKGGSGMSSSLILAIIQALHLQPKHSGWNPWKNL